MERSHVLPMLLQERYEEVDGQVGVHDEGVGGHGNVSDAHVQAEHLFHLQLDGSLDFINLVG